MPRVEFDPKFRPPVMTAGDYARARSTGATYISRTFQNANPYSQDSGKPSRFVQRVFDAEPATVLEGAVDPEEHIIDQLSTRTQLRALVTRAQGVISELEIQSVPTAGEPKSVLKLNRNQTREFLEFVRTLENVDPVGGDERTRIDDSALTALLSDTETMARLYEQSEEVLRALIAEDANATDVIAIAHRRKVVAEFERLLEDDAHFDELSKSNAGPESVWQTFFEGNPWLLGAGLSDQLLTSWDEEKLERYVSGFDITGPGKRADAVLRTAGAVRNLVIAEFKHHRTGLLHHASYRVKNYRPSTELAGGVAQVQGTVHEAVEHIGHRLRGTDAGGFESNAELTYLVKPKAYLVVGSLEQFKNEEGVVHDDKATSFELYRRNLHLPEVVTFDELLARARWITNHS